MKLFRIGYPISFRPIDKLRSFNINKEKSIFININLDNFNRYINNFKFIKIINNIYVRKSLR